MNLQQLKSFVLVVELKKLYLVAQKLQLTQPTVTFHLNKLQEELGISLFHTRSYHVIKLTDAGKAFYHYAAQICALSAEAESLMELHRGTAAGHLAIGSTHTPATYLLPPLLEQLKRNFPGLTVLLDVRPASYILERVKQYELDMGIISHMKIEDPDLLMLPLIQDDLVLIMDPEHPLADIEEVTPAMLAAHPLISHEEGSISRQMIDRWAQEHQVELNTSMVVSGSEALKSAVRHRIGYGMIAEASIQQELAEGKLRSRPIPGWGSRRYIYAVRHRNKLISPALKSFWELLQQMYANADESHGAYTKQEQPR